MLKQVALVPSSSQHKGTGWGSNTPPHQERPASPDAHSAVLWAQDFCTSAKRPEPYRLALQEAVCFVSDHGTEYRASNANAMSRRLPCLALQGTVPQALPESLPSPAEPSTNV